MSGATIGSIAVHREAWLSGFAAAVVARLESRGIPVPKHRVSCGFPTSKRAIGECWPSGYSGDGHYECFVSPSLGEALAAAKTCAHEVAHVADECANGHGAAWRRIAKAIGLDGKAKGGAWTDEGKAWAEAVIDDLGPYPHAALNPPSFKGGDSHAIRPRGPDQPKPQTARMLKCHCEREGCGYTIRTTRKWIEVAVPVCPVHPDQAMKTA